MRRALATAAGTAAGLAALLAYKSGPAPRQPFAAPGPTSSTDPPSTTEPSTQAAPPPTMQAAPAPTTRATPSTGPPAAPSAASGPRTVRGPVVPTRYGDVQVQVTVRAGRVVDVTPLVLPEDRARSQRISEEAAPILRREVLSADGAAIDTVSGATYTSEGYARSLQAALDAARR